MTDSPPIVAFQGEHGAYSEQAVRQHFGREVAALPCRTFLDITDALQDGRDLTHVRIPLVARVHARDEGTEGHGCFSRPGRSERKRPGVNLWRMNLYHGR